MEWEETGAAGEVKAGAHYVEGLISGQVALPWKNASEIV
jgi:hypothetical protein